MDLPAELLDDILLRVATSEPRHANDLKGAALANRAFYAATKPFLETPVARAAEAATSLAEIDETYQRILTLHPALRVRHAATLFARWPELSAQDQEKAVSALMATLDSVTGVAKSPYHESGDPFAAAAAALRKLRTVRAANPGFDEIFARVARLPLAKIPTWIPLREIGLCAAIPKLSVARRLGAFNLLLGDVADRYAQDGNRSGYLSWLPKVLPTLLPKEHESAALRLFEKAEEGAKGEEIQALLARLPLDRLDQSCRLTVFDKMIRLGSILSESSRRILLQGCAEKWVAALEPQHRQHARTQIESLRP